MSTVVERLTETCGALTLKNAALARENATLKEQNALLTVQVQELLNTLRRVHPYINDPTAYDHAGYALTTHPQQVKSEDAMDAARYRYLRDKPDGREYRVIPWDCHRDSTIYGDELDAAIDASISAQDGDS